MPAAIEHTYKARDVEGTLDLYFYRRIGFLLARAGAKLGLNPAALTALSGFFGLAAGHLYYYRDLHLNLIGMALHVVSNAFDNADGQLARLTNQGSRSGRTLDSISDHLVFVFIYLHLALRCAADGASPFIWLLALVAGLSHGVQGAVADFYRNAYIFFVTGRSRAEFDSSATLRAEFRRLSWKRERGQKFLLLLYLNFTAGQERYSPDLLRLRTAAWNAFPAAIPDWLRERYRMAAKPMFFWVGFLTTNARMLILFACLILDRPAWYLIIELTLLNLVLIFIFFRQHQLCRVLLPAILESPKLSF